RRAWAVAAAAQYGTAKAGHAPRRRAALGGAGGSAPLTSGFPPQDRCQKLAIPTGATYISRRQKTDNRGHSSGRGAMSARDCERSITSMRLMAELGAAHGLSVRACLAGTGVRERDLEDAAALVA